MALITALKYLIKDYDIVYTSDIELTYPIYFMGLGFYSLVNHPIHNKVYRKGIHATTSRINICEK